MLLGKYFVECWNKSWIVQEIDSALSMAQKAYQKWSMLEGTGPGPLAIIEEKINIRLPKYPAGKCQGGCTPAEA